MSDKLLRIFYSGIGGSGTSALALFDALRGRVVSGSDRAFDHDPHHPAYAPLKAAGIEIVPQDGSGITDTLDFAVMSTAVEEDMPEIVRARELGIPIKTRPEYLAEIVSSYRTVAVSGTSGKSTASGMLAHAMRELDMSPNFLGGGRVKGLRSGTNPGNCLRGDSDILVIEACESDGTIVNYRPAYTILLNLALDHKGLEETARMFEALASNTSGSVFVNADDERLRRLAISDPVTFSIDTPSELKAEDLSLAPRGSEFSVEGVRFRLAHPGRYNVYNALSAIAVLRELGVTLKDASVAIASFRGIERRFDVMLDEGDSLVIDDYAHNPHKIRALIEAVKPLRSSVCYVFQPHGFGPTKLMLEGYIEAFSSGLRDEDNLVVLPIYYAGGTTSRDISGADIARGVAANGRSAEAVESRAEVLGLTNRFSSFVVFGARDETLSDLARELADALSKR